MGAQMDTELYSYYICDEIRWELKTLSYIVTHHLMFCHVMCTLSKDFVNNSMGVNLDAGLSLGPVELNRKLSTLLFCLLPLQTFEW